MQQKIRFVDLPAAWQAGTRELLPEFGFVEAQEGVSVRVCRGDGLRVEKEGQGIVLTVSRMQDFFRALSHIRPVLENGVPVHERYTANTMGLMPDCSRNAVLSVAGAKRMMRYLAMMGFDAMMLYIEDTYLLKDYPYFGRMRGAYTAEELKEMDDYAAMLGIELIPAVQTLAHLSQMLRWPAMREYLDIDDIMLADSEKTYQLIDDLLAHFSACLRSRRINLGMDEAHHLGRGKYLDQHGFTPSTDIMLHHLDRVVSLCRKHGLAPMIWSDMFFRMAFDGKYYVDAGEIAPEVMAKVPKGLTLIFWDYYSNESARRRFSHMLECHLKFPHNETAFAGGAWVWSGFAPHARFSVYSSRIQLQECQKRGMKDFYVTAWGDNGRETSLFTTLTTLLLYAEFAYGGEPDEARLEKRMRETFGIGFEEMLTLDAPDDVAHAEEQEPQVPKNPCKYLLYNDPLEGLMDGHMKADTVADAYREAENRLSRCINNERFGYLFRTAASLCRVLVRKSDFTVRLRRAYLAGDKKALAVLAEETDLIAKDLAVFHEQFRDQWNRENKPYGFAVQDLRLGGLKERLAATRGRIEEYLAGKVPNIPELEEPVLPYDPRHEGDYMSVNNWRATVSSCVV